LSLKKETRGHLRPAYQITTRSAWLDPTTGPPGKENGGGMAWRFQQQDKRQKALSNGDWQMNANNDGWD